MKIIKYEKKGNDKYRVYLENNTFIDLYEDVIIKNNLLYKKELDDHIIENISNDNEFMDIYNKCVKYIMVRIRSIHEIKEYIQKKGYEEDVIDKCINKLIKNNLLNDSEFTRAFVLDKIRFSSMGPFKIRQELKKHEIDDPIIDKYICEIDDKIIDDKINKQISKFVKNNKKKSNIRNKIYMNLYNNGFTNEMILRNLSNYKNIDE